MKIINTQAVHYIVRYQAIIPIATRVIIFKTMKTQ
jgi:hypothetical protein